MARPKKKGLSYFPFDVDFFSDKDIKVLRAKYGTDGITVYIYLLCEVYRNGYYAKINEDDMYVIADELNLTKGLIEQVLTFLASRSLLRIVEVGKLADQGNAAATSVSRSLPNGGGTLAGSDTIITSPGIQRRYQEAVRERALKTPIQVDGFWLLEEAETETFIKVTHNEGFSGNNGDFSGNNGGFSTEKVHKVKESKVKESKVYKESSLRSDSSSDRRSDYDAVKDMWNELDGLGNIKGIRAITEGSKRRDYVRARLKQYGLGGFREAIERVKRSDFLQGRHKGRPWAITFDWFVLPSNFQKVIEGNYDDSNTRDEDDRKWWK